MDLRESRRRGRVTVQPSDNEVENHGEGMKTLIRGEGGGRQGREARSRAQESWRPSGGPEGETDLEQ